MTLIWTKSGLPLSKLIRWGLNEPVSHFGIVFDNGIVFHSNLLGTHIEWYKAFTQGCTIVYTLDYPMALIDEEAVYRSILDTYDGDSYDYGAFSYFLWRGLLFKFLGIPFPSKNEWNTSGKFLCTELAGVLPDAIVKPDVKAEDLSIISPYKLYQQIASEI